MTTRAVDEVDEWDSAPFSGGYRGLHDLVDDEFSGVVRAGRPMLCMLNGTVVGILEGDIDDFEDASGTAYRAPSPALPLLALMQERNDEVRAKYYTEDTAISEVDGTLSDGGFTGYLVLSENVLSGDYFVVYHEGRRMAVAFVGNTGQLLTGDEAFDRADGEVGIYEVRPAEIDPVEILEVEDEPESTGGAGAAAGAVGSAAGSDVAASEAGESDAEPDESVGESPPEASDEASATNADDSTTAAASAEGSEDATAAESPAETEAAETTAEPTTDAGETATAATDRSAEATDPSTDTTGSAADASESESAADSTAADADQSASDPAGSGSGRGTGRDRSTEGRDSDRSRTSSDRSRTDTEESARSDRSRTDTEESARSDRSGTGRSDDRSEQGSGSGSSGRRRSRESSERATDADSGRAASSETRPGNDAAGRADSDERERAGSGSNGSDTGPNAGGGTGPSAGSDTGSAAGGSPGSAGGRSGGGPSDRTTGGSASAGSADDLETRSIPSLDPAQTGPSEDTGGVASLGGVAGPDQSSAGGPSGASPSAPSRSSGATRTGNEPDSAGSQPARTEREKGRAAGQSAQREASAGARDASATAPEGGSPEPADPAAERGRGARPESAEPAGPDHDERVAELEERLEEREIEIERLEGELADAEAEADDLRATLSDVRAERDDLRERVGELESERDRIRSERDDLQSEVERLETERDDLETEVEEIEEEFGAAGAAERRMSAGEALDQTNLFVRYESKGQATLESAHAGNASRQEVGENLGLEYHTQFETDAVSVGGQPFDEFLRNTIQYQFVTWVINDLLYEIRDTGKTAALQELYDAIPRIDRAELNGTISAEYTEDAQERRSQESFDVVVRDRMGNPLMVANLNDSRQAASESMMSALVTASSHVGESDDALAASFLVTSSFFEPAALETAADATSGGLLNRDKRESFVKLARKRGYHLCLVEAREDKFHLAVPEL